MPCRLLVIFRLILFGHRSCVLARQRRCNLFVLIIRRGNVIPSILAPDVLVGGKVPCVLNIILACWKAYAIVNSMENLPRSEWRLLCMDIVHGRRSLFGLDGSWNVWRFCCGWCHSVRKFCLFLESYLLAGVSSPACRLPETNHRLITQNFNR